MARESGSTALQATVILLSLITVGLGASTWMTYSAMRREIDSADQARAQQQEQTKNAISWKYTASAYQHMLTGENDRSMIDGLKGQAKADDPDVKRADDSLKKFDEDMKTFGEVAPEGSKSYKNLVQYAIDTISKRNVEVTDLRKQDNTNAENLKSTRESEQNRAAVAEKAAEAAKAELAAERQKFVDERDRFKTEMDKKNKELADKEKAAKEAEENSSKTISALTIAAAKSKELADIYKAKLEEMQAGGSPLYENPDGEVTWVSHRRGLVWVNLGSADGLQRQQTFAVYAHDENNMTVDKKKGDIEITQILEPHLAEARIVSEKSINPFLPGDKLFTPGWSPGQRLHFAIGGFIDIDGDGLSDREQIRTIIQANNAIIDAEVSDDGKRVGSVKVSTRYFVQGVDPRDKAAAGVSGDAAVKAQEEFGRLSGECEQLNIDRIDVSKFLALMGHKAQQRTTEMGAKRASKFKPRKPGEGAKKPSDEEEEAPKAKKKSDDEMGEGEDAAADDADPFG